MRVLLARELEQLEQDLTHSDLAMNMTKLGERLHRLRASCGFCGAIALAASATEWQEALRNNRPSTNERRDAFIAICRKTAIALGN